MIKNGWYEESNETYHANEGIGSTGIKKVLKTPAHYRADSGGPSPEVSRVGNLVHSYFLERELFEKNRVMAPIGSRVKKEIKVLWEYFFEDLAERELLALPLDEVKALKASDVGLAFKPDCFLVTEKDLRMLAGMEYRLNQNATAKELLTGGIREKSGYLNALIEDISVLVKCRPDSRKPETFELVDIKTTDDASAFGRKVWDLGYHIQAALYLDVSSILCGPEVEYHKMSWVVMEKEPPYGVKVYEITNDCIEYEAGKGDFEKGLKIYAQCLKSGKWPCYPGGSQHVRLPRWLIPEVS